MAFRPCNYPLDYLVMRQMKAKAAGHQRRQEKMSRGAMPQDVADSYERFDSAVLKSLELLALIEREDPALIERLAPQVLARKAAA